MQKESGRKFRQLRRHLDITQTEFAKFMGVTLPTIHKWESSEPRFLTLQFEAMLKAGINPLFFFGDFDMLLPGWDIVKVAEMILKTIQKIEK